VDNDLKFAQHISKITHIGHSQAALILKCFFTRDHEVLTKAYCTYVRPILEYCTPVWSPHHTGLNDKLENVQRRFTKRISGLSCVSYEERLVHLKLDSLRVRRIKQDMIMCYKIINDLVAMNCSDFFAFNNVRTRGHNFKLCLPECRVDVRKFSFARRVCLTWDNLPIDVVNAVSLNSFKRKLSNVCFIC